MKIVTVLVLVFAFAGTLQAHQHAMPHQMQHGFVLSVHDTYATHLVASGHHSFQSNLAGHLLIEDPQEEASYEERKSRNVSGQVYFLFQAQTLDLPSLKAGQVLSGHIVESPVGGYNPKNIIVRKATYKVEKVLLHIPNPFFGE